MRNFISEIFCCFHFGCQEKQFQRLRKKKVLGMNNCRVTSQNGQEICVKKDIST